MKTAIIVIALAGMLAQAAAADATLGAANRTEAAAIALKKQLLKI